MGKNIKIKVIKYKLFILIILFDFLLFTISIKISFLKVNVNWCLIELFKVIFMKKNAINVLYFLNLIKIITLIYTFK